jgi:hypothetical protein
VSTHFSNYLEKALLGLTLLGSSLTIPVTPHISLATSSNSDGDVFVEVASGTAYARQPALFVTPTSGPTWRTFLASKATFPTATTPWGTVTHVGIYDTVSGGNLLYWAPLSASRAIATNDVVEFPLGSGGLEVQLD